MFDRARDTGVKCFFSLFVIVVCFYKGWRNVVFLLLEELISQFLVLEFDFQLVIADTFYVGAPQKANFIQKYFHWIARLKPVGQASLKPQNKQDLGNTIPVCKH